MTHLSRLSAAVMTASFISTLLACRSPEEGREDASLEQSPTQPQQLFAVIPFAKSGYLRGPCEPEGALTGWTPSAEDVARIEDRLVEIETKLRKASRGRLGKDDYVRQYTGVVVGTERQVFLQATLAKNAPSSWMERGECVLGGGITRWNVVFVPTLNSFFDFQIGG